MRLSQGSLYAGAVLALGLGAATGALFGQRCRDNFQARSVEAPSLEEVVEMPVIAIEPVSVPFPADAAADTVALEIAAGTIAENIAHYAPSTSTQTTDDIIFVEQAEPRHIPKPHYSPLTDTGWNYLQSGWQAIKNKDFMVSDDLKIIILLENLQGAERDELLRDITDYCTNAEGRMYTAIELVHAVIGIKNLNAYAAMDAYQEQIARAMGNSLSDSINSSTRTGKDFTYECAALWEKISPDVRAIAPESQAILKNMDARSVQLLTRTIINEYKREIQFLSQPLDPTSGFDQAGLDAKVEEYQRKKQNVLNHLRVVELMK